MTHRRGATVPEMIVVAWLFALVLAAAGRFAGAQGRLLARAHDRVRAETLLREGRLVLGAELRGLYATDIVALAADSLRLRAFRGGGPVCATSGHDLFIGYRGVRRPDPDKDSLLVLHDGTTAGAALPVLAVAADSSCGPGYRLDVGRELGARGWALVFETGSYHIAGGALRYRRGAGGRQPFTEALLEGGRLDRTADGRLRVRLRFHPDSIPRLGPYTPALTIAAPNGVP